MTLPRHPRLVRLARLVRDEIGLLAALAIVAGGILAFLRLADQVVEGETEAFDRALLLAFRAPEDPAAPLGPSWLPTMVRDVTALGGVAALTLITLFSLAYLLLVGKRGAALLLAVSVVGGTVISQGLKVFFDRPRPDLVPGAPVELTASFPSGHSMMAAVTYLTIGALLTRVEDNRRARAFFLVVAVILTALIGISRISLGVHWPTDVLAGWCLGASWAMLCWAVALWLQRRGQVE